MKSYLIVLLAAGLFSCTSTPPQAPAEVQQMTAQTFREQNMNSKTVLVDVRTPEEFATGHLEGALNSDFRGGAFATEMQNWDKDKTYYLYCASGNRSGKAAELMKEAGFRNIVNVGAFQDLKEAGLPTETGNQ
ncbi:rhodanese-like domain-containing protein [Pontibacter akesuensis]|uniref:Rhodanese-related sulfurtransferase n=1 Tax=Pontibacter akesuensis TaxID=388950 RepID=A0A1I7H001_9BACT|nr:rhodanese-like domain-containing protein [Pontibacter akesuensis]SFU53992.1 Rhodanese-related sulfurtransferase [Pontibacter akesuensis]